MVVSRRILFGCVNHWMLNLLTLFGTDGFNVLIYYRWPSILFVTKSKVEVLRFLNFRFRLTWSDRRKFHFKLIECWRWRWQLTEIVILFQKSHLNFFCFTRCRSVSFFYNYKNIIKGKIRPRHWLRVYPEATEVVLQGFVLNSFFSEDL